MPHEQNATLGPFSLCTCSMGPTQQQSFSCASLQRTPLAQDRIYLSCAFSMARLVNVQRKLPERRGASTRGSRPETLLQIGVFIIDPSGHPRISKERYVRRWEVWIYKSAPSLQHRSLVRLGVRWRGWLWRQRRRGAVAGCGSGWCGACRAHMTRPLTAPFGGVRFRGGGSRV